MRMVCKLNRLGRRTIEMLQRKNTDSGAFLYTDIAELVLGQSLCKKEQA